MSDRCACVWRSQFYVEIGADFFGMAALSFLCRGVWFSPKLSYHRNVSLPIFYFFDKKTNLHLYVWYWQFHDTRYSTTKSCEQFNGWVCTPNCGLHMHAVFCIDVQRSAHLSVLNVISPLQEKRGKGGKKHSYKYQNKVKCCFLYKLLNLCSAIPCNFTIACWVTRNWSLT